MKCAALALALVACSGDPAPSRGSYTIAFPSTAAAIATDFVQILIFDVNGADRGSLCEDLITQRLTAPDQLVPSVNPPADPANICEMRAGKKPVHVPYGEHALLAVGQRKDGNSGTKDFLIGCAIMTIGNGDAPLSIPVRLVSVNQPVPATTCGSVGEFCDEKCDQ